MIAGLALAGAVSLGAAARQLETSPRTLQRRLNEHGVTFWALVEESRLKIAGALLRETDLKIQEIAASIGYSTPGGFARAFSGWAGRSPTAYRRAPNGQRARGGEWREVVSDAEHPPLASEHGPSLPEEP